MPLNSRRFCIRFCFGETAFSGEGSANLSADLLSKIATLSDRKIPHRCAFPSACLCGEIFVMATLVIAAVAVVLSAILFFLQRKRKKSMEAHRLIERLRHSTPDALENVAEWSSQAAGDVRRVLGAREISIWQVENETLSPLAGQSGATPSLAQMVANSTNIVVKNDEIRALAKGVTGEVNGVIVVAGVPNPGNEASHRLLSALADQLGRTLEVLAMRKRVAAAEAKRDAAKQEMADRGIAAAQICPLCQNCYDDSTSRCAADGMKLEKKFVLPFRIADRYRLLRLLGHGGMGAVFLGKDEKLNRMISIKVILAELMANNVAKQRMHREAQLIAQLQHPGIVAIHDFGELPDGSTFLLMEFLNGIDLARLMTLQGSGTPEQVATVLLQTSDALSAAHSIGVIHRDIKPGNLFVVPGAGDFQTKILDFGLAKSILEDVSLTATGVIVGTPGYMSPEQIGGGTLTERSDLFSLAAVIFELLTGRAAFPGDNIPSIYTSILEGQLPSLIGPLPGASPELNRLFLQALELNQDNRPQLSLWARSLADMLKKISPSVQGWNLDEVKGLDLP